jgi:hypothetical protein
MTEWGELAPWPDGDQDQAAEDTVDAEAARDSLTDGAQPVPWEDIKAEAAGYGPGMAIDDAGAEYEVDPACLEAGA